MNDLVAQYDRLIAEKSSLIISKKEKERKLEKIQNKIEICLKARIILGEVIKQTQNNFKKYIESLVTLAIRSVYDRPYTFHLQFKESRNKIECVPIIKEKNLELSPRDDMDGGIIDITSFAFRIVLWSLSNPKSRNVFIADEPFRFLGELIGKAGEFLKKLSRELNFQLIIISHNEELINICDRIWRITHDGTKAHIKRIGGSIKRRNLINKKTLKIYK